MIYRNLIIKAYAGGRFGAYGENDVKKLRISHLLIAVVGLSMLPVALLGYLFVAQSTKDIAFAERELLGARYLQGIYDDFHAMMAGATPSAALMGVASELDPVLGTGDTMANYLKVRQASLAAPGEPYATAFLDLTDEVADASYLILDPDLDTYHLTDVLAFKMPGALASGLEARAASVAGQSSDLLITTGWFDSFINGIVDSYETAAASSADPSVRSLLGPRIAALRTEADRFTTLGRNASDPASLSASPPH